MNAKFHEIETEIAAMLDVPDEELNDEQRTAMAVYLDELAGQEAEKVDRFCQFLRLETSRVAALKEEAQRLASRAKSIEGRLAWLRAHYLKVMRENGLRKVSGKVYTASVRESQSVYVENEKLVPESFRLRWEESRIDRVAIRNALKAGQTVPGCSLMPSYSLQTR